MVTNRLERVIEAAIRSMVMGHHTPHCYRAWIKGKGYINDGNSALFDRADYLTQLERSARSEQANMGYARTYAGYSPENQPARGIVWADWNVFPRGLDTTLERMGFAVEWSDCVTTCDDCNACISTNPAHMWDTLPNDNLVGDTLTSEPYRVLCLDCLQDWAENERAQERQDQADKAFDTLCDALDGAFGDYIYR